MYKKGCFFRAMASSSSYTTGTPEWCIQIPSTKDRTQMYGMPAGLSERQDQRLTNMVHTIEQIKAEHASLPVVTTDEVNLPAAWEQLFATIMQGDKTAALALFNNIPQHDAILQALLLAHPLEYLQELITYCIVAKSAGTLALESEITITPGTFAILVKDIATTLFHSAKVHFSFGLPTHHAFSSGGSGFCIVDKTAMLIKYRAQICDSPLKFIIVGTDVNRDNGLSHDLMESASELDICHVDVFDSLVYPCQDHRFISHEFNSLGTDAGQKIKCWSHGQMNYFAVDLSLTPRGTGTAHAALLFALQKIEEQIASAEKKEQKVMLILPTGWDSHQDETAPCGKFIHGRTMRAAEAQQTRFSDQDLTYFYERVFALYHVHKKSIAGIYWGLEGGYNRPMYERQIQLLMSMVLAQLVPQNVNQNEPGRLF